MWSLSEYRSITGEGNNEDQLDWGVPGSHILRFAGVAYADDISAPSGVNRPSAREISNTVMGQSDPILNVTGVSDLYWAWGQFIDHDITLFRAPDTAESFDILVPVDDIFFDPAGTGTAVIPLDRSGFDPATGSDAANPRAQVNDITAFIDASMVYGSDPTRATFLRDAGGKLKVSEGNFLPLNDGSLPNAGPDGSTGPVAGDVRAGENVALLSLHTIFVREHNRLVDEIDAAHPDYDDERLYQEAKAIVEAEIQVITYKEFLPLLLGANTLDDYQGYRADIEPQIANIFATAAYRFGHTMLSAELLRLNEDGGASSFGSLALRDAFFNPEAMTEQGGVEPLLRGLAAQWAQEVDPYIVDDVRNFLFGAPGEGGFDLASLNIQRGRDHGLPSYNEARTAYGLTPFADFSDITSDPEIRAKLQAAFGSVDKIDVFVGGLAEDHASGAMVGPLFQAVLVEQFQRLQDGDRFWYENRFSGEDLEQIKSVTLAEIIQLNSGIDYLQQNAMLAYNRVGGTAANDRLHGGDERDLLIGFDGNDRINAGQSDDHVEAGNGHDKVKGGAGDDYINGGGGNDRLYGGYGNDKLLGGDGHDKIKGDAGDDYINGGGGNDRLYGGYGNDELLGGDGHDRIKGGAGDDYINGGGGNDRLYGGYGNDKLLGGDGHDKIKGGAGDDVLVGGSGKDHLFGGSGADTFRFVDALDIGDVIHDFDPLVDIIDLSSLTDIDSASVHVEVDGYRGEINASTIGGVEFVVADLRFVHDDLHLLDTDPELHIIV